MSSPALMPFSPSISVLKLVAFTLLLFASHTASHPVEKIAQIKTRVDQLSQSYDYIIIGGGTSGLTVADRLTEDGTKTVLVVEYGPLESNIEILTPVNGLTSFPADMYNWTAVPQPGMNNRIPGVLAGAIVGGGSAERLGNPGWGWNGILPYFQKSVTFTPPSLDQQEKYNMTYNLDAYGQPGAVQSSYPPFIWPGTILEWQGWKDFGIPVQPRIDPGSTQNIVITTIFAKKEVILAAGAVGTPLVLQRSGIGSKTLLQEASIDVIVDLPGVGANLQDHSVISASYNFTKNPALNPNLMYDPTYKAAALAEYHANKSGPLTACNGPAGAFLPLSIVTDDYHSLITGTNSQDPSQYLPPTYTPSLIRGFLLQRNILTNSYASSKAAVLETPIGGASSATLVFLKPLSRGTVTINTTNPFFGDPVVDFRVLSNPIDLKMYLLSLRFAREVFSSPSFINLLGPVEVTPGANVTSDEDIAAWVHNNLYPSTAHLSGTAAMIPRELGGVVDAELRVYGVRGVRVVDASVMPLVPGTHTSSTVYAVAEKAADIIKGRA